MSKKKMMLVGLMCSALTTGMMAADEGANEETFVDMEQQIEQVEFKISKKFVDLVANRSVEIGLITQEELSEIDHGKRKEVKVVLRKGESISKAEFIKHAILATLNVLFERVAQSEKDRYQSVCDCAEFMNNVEKLLDPVFNKVVKIEENGQENPNNMEEAQRQNNNNPGEGETLGQQMEEQEEDNQE